jgi:hypothetical protein
VAARKFRIRRAFNSDFKGLLDFYQRHRSPALPLETAKVVGDAIDSGRLLVVKPWSGSETAAAGSLFQLTPQASLTYVSELAGMRVTGMVGGLRPVSMQKVLIGLRLLGHAAGEREPFRAGATNSIIAAVHRDNRDSIENIEEMALRSLPEPFPDWLRHNQIGWYGTAVDETWRHYYADNEACVRSVELLESVGLFTRIIRLHRTNRDSGLTEDFEFYVELNDLHDAAEDLKAIQQRKAHVALVPPPPSLVFTP